MLIRKKKPWDDVRSSEITPESVYLNRRQFMGASAALVGAAALSPGRAAAELRARMPQQEVPPAAWGEGIRDEMTSYEDITTYNNFYEFGTDKRDPFRNSGDFEPEPWTVRVEGHVKNTGTYSVEDLARPEWIEDRIYRLRCVEGWSMVIPWRGVPLRNIIAHLEPTSQAKFVTFETVVRPEEMPGQRRPILDWPYFEGLRIDEAANELTFMVTGLYGMDGLPNQNGAPLRLMTPWKYGFKSAKSIVKIGFVEEMPLNTWKALQSNEYGFYANVNPNVDHPRWSQATERRIGEFGRRETIMFNGYGEQVAHMYAGMDLSVWY